MRLIDDHKIPVDITRLAEDPIVVAGKNVEAGQPQATAGEGVATLVDQVLRKQGRSRDRTCPAYSSSCH